MFLDKNAKLAWKIGAVIQKQRKEKIFKMTHWGQKNGEWSMAEIRKESCYHSRPQAK